MLNIKKNFLYNRGSELCENINKKIIEFIFKQLTRYLSLFISISSYVSPFFSKGGLSDLLQ